MPVRPRLRTGYRPVDRGDGAVQLGLGERALTLDGLPPRLAELLRRLDGTATTEQLQSGCARAGLPVSVLEGLLEALEHAGALDRTSDRDRAQHRRLPHDQLDALVECGLTPDAARAALARPARARVTVVGRGLLPTALVEALTPLCGSVQAGDDADAPGRSDVIVLTARDALDPLVATRAALTGTPLLPVVTDGRTVTIGPWSATADDPCPACLDLRRADADDAWPHLLEQVSRPDDDGLARRVHADPIVATLTGSVVAQWVRRRIVGLPDSPGLTCEVDPWDLGMTHRVWPVHPRCGRHRRTEAAAGPMAAQR